MVIDFHLRYGKIICMVAYVSVSRIDFSISFLYPFILNVFHHFHLDYKQTLRAKD